MLPWNDIIKYPPIVEMANLTSEQRKGFAFEFLVCNLCRCMFDLPIEHTAFTNDKGKDIVIKDGANSIWVECKNYERTIGTHVVSSTLVMAMLEKVKKIYVFSQSKISERMVEELLEYSNLTQIEVTVISDQELEKQILKYRSDPRLEFEKFFPSGAMPNDKKSATFDFYITTDKVQYFLGDIVKISAIIKNTCDKKDINTFSITLDKERFAKIGLEYISGEFSKAYSLAYCKVQRIDFKFRIAKYNKVISVPTITITDSNNVSLQSNECKIECSKLVRSFLVGQSLNIVRNFSLNKITSRFIVIDGKSGVGKSRLLEELDITHLKLGYRTTKIDLENVSGIDAVKKMIANLYKLPFVHLDADYVVNDTEDDVNKILYERDYDFDKNCQIIADVIYKKAVNEKCFIGIDNIQEADLTVIKIINSIISKSDGEEVGFQSCIFCLCFNTERLMPIENMELNLKLKGLTRYYFTVKPFNEQSDFSNEENNSTDNLCKQFIFSCLHISHCNHETECLLLELAKCCSFNPLHIQQTLQYIVDNNLVNISSNDCSIVDIHKYNHIIHESFALEDIFLRRYNLLIDNCSVASEQDFKDIIILLCYLGEIEKHLFIRIFKKTDDVLRLIVTGFIIDNDGKYVFAHSKLKRFFEKKFEINEDAFYTLPTHLAKSVYENTLENNPMHWAAKFDYKDDPFTRDDAQRSLLFLKHCDCDIKFLLILYRMTIYANFFNLRDKLFIMSKVISKYEKKFGVEKTIKVFAEKFFEFEQSADLCIEADDEIYIDLVRIIANKYILLHDNKEGYRILENALNSLKKRNIKPNHKLLSILYNRLSVCAGSQNRQSEARDLAKRGLTEAKRINDLHNIIENLADLGYSYYKLNKREKCIKIWDRIYQYHNLLLKSESISEGEKQFSIYKCSCNRALLHMLQQSKNMKSAISYLEDNVASITRPFYRIKACLLIAAYYIIRLSDEGHQPCSRFFDYLKEADLTISLYGEIRSSYKVDYLYANYYYIAGDKDLALVHYRKTMIELETAMTDINTFESYIFLFYDLKNKIRELSNTYDKCKNEKYENLYCLSIGKKKPGVGLLTNKKKNLSFPIF